MTDRIALTRRSLLLSSVLTTALPLRAEIPVIYRNRTASVPDRVRDLLSRMTLDEKVAQLRAMGTTKSQFMDADGNFSREKALKAIPAGIGQVGAPYGTVGTPARTRFWREPTDAIAQINAIQRFHVEETRLGIPTLFHQEAAHGFLIDGATIFPSPPALGSTWDPDLVEQAFAVAGREARLGGVTNVLAPDIDLMREPRWGRSGECFGEDPYHVGQIGLAAVRGLQGRTRPLRPDRVFTTLKHFVHGAPQQGLNAAPANMSERDLRENYLVPFATIIKLADPAAVMPSYNEVEGVPSHANRALLTDTGRGRLGFKGAYFSDYEGVTNLITEHHVAADDDEAAMLALSAGVDVELPEGKAFSGLGRLVKAGRVQESTIDAAVARVLTLKFEAGLFESPYVDAKRAARSTDTAASAALARKVAQKSAVLLKNDGILPLDPKAAIKLAVIGPNAAEPMFGGYSGTNAKAVGVLDGLRRAGTSASIEYAEGVRLVETGKGAYLGPPSEMIGLFIKRVPEAENAARLQEAVELASRSDVILLVLGDNATITREATIRILPGDRDSLDLYGDQNALVEAMIQTGKPIVALLLNGRPITVNRLADKANALLEGWFLGQEGGNAVADIVFGRVNPGGKLAVSFPRSVGDLPVYYNQHPSAALRDYVETKRGVLFPFGHGLSYTDFALSPPRLSRDRISAADGVQVSVEVTNTGKRPGDEVVQLYIRDDVSSVPRPMLELKRFERLSLQPGETRTVSFELDFDALAFWNIDMKWTVEPGTFTISSGTSSAQLQSARLTVI